MNQFVKIYNLLAQLCAYAADKPVAKGRHLAEKENRTILDSPIGLRERRERDVTFIHRPLTSRIV